MLQNKERVPLTEAVFYILLALHKPMHGYGIMQFANEKSNGRMNLGPGTLYGALNSMLTKGWIKSVDIGTESRKKEYVITKEGRLVVKAEMERLQELLVNGKNIVEGGAL